jgi:hypothetical protein
VEDEMEVHTGKESSQKEGLWLSVVVSAVTGQPLV